MQVDSYEPRNARQFLASAVSGHSKKTTAQTGKTEKSKHYKKNKKNGRQL